MNFREVRYLCCGTSSQMCRVNHPLPQDPPTCPVPGSDAWRAGERLGRCALHTSPSARLGPGQGPSPSPPAGTSGIPLRACPAGLHHSQARGCAPHRLPVASVTGFVSDFFGYKHSTVLHTSLLHACHKIPGVRQAGPEPSPNLHQTGLCCCQNARGN